MKLFRFAHSPYAHKIQALLDLLGKRHVVVDVPFCDRAELATLTGGYVHVPVLLEDDGTVVCDSRKIAERLLSVPTAAAAMVPSPWDGPIWAYHDWVDGPLEDLLFRLASPRVRDGFRRPDERAMYTLIKERKFGTGCVDQWEKQRDELIARARTLLVPTVRTLSAQPFLFGAKPTLADAALSGQFGMLAADATLPPITFGEVLPGWLARLDAARRTANPAQS